VIGAREVVREEHGDDEHEDVRVEVDEALPRDVQGDEARVTRLVEVLV